MNSKIVVVLSSAGNEIDNAGVCVLIVNLVVRNLQLVSGCCIYCERRCKNGLFAIICICCKFSFWETLAVHNVKEKKTILLKI